MKKLLLALLMVCLTGGTALAVSPPNLAGTIWTGPGQVIDLILFPS